MKTFVGIIALVTIIACVIYYVESTIYIYSASRRKKQLLLNRNKWIVGGILASVVILIVVSIYICIVKKVNYELIYIANLIFLSITWFQNILIILDDYVLYIGGRPIKHDRIKQVCFVQNTSLVQITYGKHGYKNISVKEKHHEVLKCYLIDKRLEVSEKV